MGKIKMEVEIISKEFIKPCSSTPSHLKTYKVSLLEQFMPCIFFSTALFYPDFMISQKSIHVLKYSLSKILSHYYPLAGRIKDSVSIDCNDQGAYYEEAKANISMSEYLRQPDLNLLPKLVPDLSSFNQNPIGAPLVFIQETTFSCGGLVIGFFVSHLYLDGPSLASFIKAWASAAASSGENVPYPDLEPRSLFPMYENGDFPNEALFPTLWTPFVRKDKTSMKRLIFDASAIHRLKAKAKSSSVEHPSRVEVVSAIIAKSVKAALDVTSGVDKLIAISHNVNMRRKAMPPFPDSSLGNFIWPAYAISTEKETELSSLVYELRNAIKKVDAEFVKDAIEGGSSMLFRDLKVKRDLLLVDEMELMVLNSWCNFGIYNNSDFGWGKPIWISIGNLCVSEEMIPIINMGILNDTVSGDGVEAWLYLPRDLVAALEKNDELLQYASFDLSPLGINYT